MSPEPFGAEISSVNSNLKISFQRFLRSSSGGGEVLTILNGKADEEEAEEKASNKEVFEVRATRVEVAVEGKMVGFDLE